MKRLLFYIQPTFRTYNCCCPGHDTWPNDTYRNNRSKKARSRDKKRENRYARRLLKAQLTTQVKALI